MGNYELTAIVDGKKTAAVAKKIFEKVASEIASLDGKVSKEDSWGIKDLAYPIQKIPTGNYSFFEIELDGVKVSELKKKLNEEEEIIRYLLIRKE